MNALKADNVVELFPRRDAATIATRHARSALDLYPEHETLLQTLKRVGFEQVLGIFDAKFWYETTSASKLYCLPFGQLAGAYLHPLSEDVWARSRGSIWPTSHHVAAVIRKYEREGTLLSTIFPNYRDYPGLHNCLQVAFPEVPPDIMAMMHRARLAGCDVYAAAPEEAIGVVGLEEELRRKTAHFGEAQRELRYHQVMRSLTGQHDPIVYGQIGETVVVLGSYGEADTPEMLTLLDVLDGMSAEL